MKRLEIAAQADLHAVERRNPRRFGEQRVSLVELAEVRFLQRAVDDVLVEPLLALRGGLAALFLTVDALLERVEKLGRLGIIAAVVAAIAFGERLRGIERARLDTRERRRVADSGRRDRDLAVDDAV